MKAEWISGWVVLALGGAAAMATPSYTAVFLPSNGATNTYANAIASNGQIVGYSTDGIDAALLWTSPYSAPIDLTPAGYGLAQANGTDGTIQTGRAATADSNVAVAWQGTSASAVFLAAPPGFSDYGAAGTGGGQIVGSGTSPTGEHALLWNGITGIGIDLNPANYSSSGAHGANGANQVGAGTPNPVNGVPQGSRALVWSGTANSAVDITPAGYAEAEAWDISGNLAVGDGSPGTGQQDALLWNISDGAYTNLGPGTAYAVAGDYEVGYRTVGPNHAMLWEGSATSAVDLNNYLPPGYASIAYGVDAEGDVVGGASDGSGYYAVEWMLTPEPAVLTLLISALFFIHWRQRHV